MSIAVCITPTDPIPSNCIVKGRCAGPTVTMPLPLRQIIVTESGTDDDLGYGLLFFALYLISYTGQGAGGGGGNNVDMGSHLFLKTAGRFLVEVWLGRTSMYYLLLVCWNPGETIRLQQPLNNSE